MVALWDLDSAVSSITDTAGNAYQLAGPSVTLPGGNDKQFMYFAIAKSAAAIGANTLTLVTTLSQIQDCSISNYRNVDKRSPIVGFATSSGSGTTASASVTTTYPNDADAVIVAGALVANSVTGVGGGATNRFTNGNGNNIEDIVASATGAYMPTATQSSGNWAFSVAAFRGSQLTAYGNAIFLNMP